MKYLSFLFKVCFANILIKKVYYLIFLAVSLTVQQKTKLGLKKVFGQNRYFYILQGSNNKMGEI